MENVGKQTESQTDRQTDRQFWESNLTVAGKGNEYQKSTNDINRLYETISTLQPLTHRLHQQEFEVFNKFLAILPSVG